MCRLVCILVLYVQPTSCNKANIVFHFPKTRNKCLCLSGMGHSHRHSYSADTYEHIWGRDLWWSKSTAIVFLCHWWFSCWCKVMYPCADPKVFSESVQLWLCFFFFLSWWGEKGSKYLYKWAIIDQPVKRHLNGISLAGQWWPNIECWLGSFVVLQEIRSSIGKKPYIFLIFQGGVWTPFLPLWIRTWCIHVKIFWYSMCALSVMYLVGS